MVIISPFLWILKAFQIRRLICPRRLKFLAHLAFLITSKVLDVRRRGATIEAYRVIRRKPAPAKPAPAGAGGGGGAIEGNAVLRPCSGP
jgi:hypothetical protein